MEDTAQPRLRDPSHRARSHSRRDCAYLAGPPSARLACGPVEGAPRTDACEDTPWPTSWVSAFAASRILASCGATGTYVENLELPGALHATFVRSPYAHARILEIDASEARALPNTQVFTAADVDLGVFPLPPFIEVDPRMHQPFVQGDVARYVGDIVAVVVTESRTAGVDAAELVMVDYEPLPSVTDPRQALEEEVLLFPEVGTNVCSQIVPGERDESLFDDCEVVVSGTLVSQRLAAAPLEPRSAAAVMGEDGRLTAWLSTQIPHIDRFGLAHALGLDPGDIRVVGPDVGGGFGAKGLAVEEMLVAWLARATGRPMRWTETRSESMVALRQGRGRCSSSRSAAVATAPCRRTGSTSSRTRAPTRSSAASCPASRS